MMNRKTTKEELYKLYWKKEYTFDEIAKIFNCARKTIKKRLKEFGIKIRTRKESMNTKRFKKRDISRKTDKNHWNWKGGIRRTFYGYIYLLMPDHPKANSRGYVQRSHLVAEEMLGRYLYPNEMTHHKNSIKDDDRPENIEITTQSKHVSSHNKKRSQIACNSF